MHNNSICITNRALYMEVKINKNKMSINGRTISIKGHLDDDNIFRVFEEYLVNHPNLSTKVIEQVRDVVKHEPNIIIG